VFMLHLQKCPLSWFNSCSLSLQIIKIVSLSLSLSHTHKHTHHMSVSLCHVPLCYLSFSYTRSYTVFYPTLSPPHPHISLLTPVTFCHVFSFSLSFAVSVESYPKANNRRRQTLQHSFFRLFFVLS
jgi:hypothetical protein